MCGSKEKSFMAYVARQMSKMGWSNVERMLFKRILSFYVFIYHLSFKILVFTVQSQS